MNKNNKNSMKRKIKDLDENTIWNSGLGVDEQNPGVAVKQVELVDDVVVDGGLAADVLVRQAVVILAVQEHGVAVVESATKNIQFSWPWWNLVSTILNNSRYSVFSFIKNLQNKLTPLCTMKLHKSNVGITRMQVS